MSVLVMCLVDVCVVSCGIFCFGSGVFGVKSVWCCVCERIWCVWVSSGW